MYLKKQHFEDLLREELEDPKDYEGKRLSANAYEFTGKEYPKGKYIFYINTPIVIRSLGNKVRLNNGGWHTVTTKKWINYGLQIHRLYQKNYAWYLQGDDRGPIPFYNGIEITD